MAFYFYRVVPSRGWGKGVSYLGPCDVCGNLTKMFGGVCVAYDCDNPLNLTYCRRILKIKLNIA